MNAVELKMRLIAGNPLVQLFEFTAGQCCEIYKAKSVKRFRRNSDIIYIPDTSLNDIRTERPLYGEEIDEALELCYTGEDFLAICDGDEAMARRVFDACDWQRPGTALDELRREDEEEAIGGEILGETEICRNVVEADSFRRLLLGAAGGYELQGYHEAAEAVMHVVDALDKLTTGGKGKSRADEDVDATAAAEVIRFYCEKRRKVDCCESCIFNKGNKGPLCPLYGSPMGWDGFGGKENG